MFKPESVYWVGRQEWLALLRGCSTHGRQPHRVANPSTASASCIFNSVLRDCKEMPGSLGFLLISPPDVQVSQSRKTILPLHNAFDRSISTIYLLPNIPVKEHWLLPILGLEGWCSVAAGLVQRKSVLDLAVQALCWHGAEANTQPCSQIRSICKHFTPDRYLVKSKWQEGRMGSIRAEGHSLHPSLLIYCPIRAVAVKNCNPLLQPNN